MFVDAEPLNLQFASNDLTDAYYTLMEESFPLTYLLTKRHCTAKSSQFTLPLTVHICWRHTVIYTETIKNDLIPPIS